MPTPSSPSTPWYENPEARSLWESGASVRDLRARLTALGYSAPAESTIRERARKDGWQRPAGGQDRPTGGTREAAQVREQGDGTAEAVEGWNYQYKATLARRLLGGETTQLQRAPAVTVRLPRPPRARASRPAGLRSVVIMLDAQVGYWQDRNDEWHGTHDEAAMCVSRQVATRFAELHGIDVLIDVGDLADFPSLSTHASAPAVVRTQSLNRTLRRVAEELAAYRAIAGPAAEVKWIMGNHEQRLVKFLQNTAPELMGLTGPDGRPVLALEYLTGARDYDVELVGPYPEGGVWLSHNFRVIHGTVAKSKAGQTNDSYLNEEVSTVAGHTTRAGIVYRDVPRGDQLRTYVSATGGGRMKVTGDVPDGGGVNDWGEPGRAAAKPWHQGVIVGFVDPEGHRVPELEYVSIYNGTALWRGDPYVATVDADGNRV